MTRTKSKFNLKHPDDKEDSVPLLELPELSPASLKPRRVRFAKTRKDVPRAHLVGSHQYEELESEVWRHHHLQRKFGTRGYWWSHDNKRVARKWAQTLMIGISTGLVAMFIIFFTGLLTDWKFQFFYKLVAMERESKVPFGTAFCFFALFNAICSSIAWLSVYIAPEAAGSGIPEVKCFLNGLSINVFEWQTIVAKVLGIIFTVSGGLPAGKEGPMVHAGAGMAMIISQSKFSNSFLRVGDSFRKYQDFHDDREQRDFVVCGAASGVAAAFGAPVGGVLFSLEEGASFWSTKLTWRCFFSAMTTVTTLFCIRTLDIQFGQAQSNFMFSFGQFFKLQKQIYNFSVWELPLFILLGALGGLIGAAFNETNKHIHKYRQKHYISNPGARYREVLFVSLLMSVVCYGIPTVWPHCTSYPQNQTGWRQQEIDLLERLVPLYCDSSDTPEYNQLASLFLTDSDTAIKQLFHFRELGNYNQPSFSSITLLTFFSAYIVVACINYGTAVPSGMFVPSLLQGAAFGRMIGHLLHLIDKRRGTFADGGTFALVGAAAMLGGMARMTISLTVLLLEATGDFQYIVPLMLTVMTARWVGNSFNEGLYDLHIELKKLNFLEQVEDDVTTHVDVTIGDVMTREPACLPAIVSVGEVFDMLSCLCHNSFPIINSSGVLMGVIYRKVLCTLIKHKAFGHFDVAPQDMGSAWASPLVNWGTLESSYPNYPEIDELSVSAEDRNALLDLRPYMDRAPMVLNEHATVQRAYKVFRSLGLRHLYIIDMHCKIVGIVTRAELVPSYLKKFENKGDESESRFSHDMGSHVITLDALHRDHV